MNKGNRVTIKDVAALAGCSPATVSLVLNGKADCIPQTTQTLIKEAVKQLNYTPNINARSMKTGKTYIVGMVIPDISNVFFAELVRHIQVELNKFGYDIILCNTEERADNDLKYINFLSGRNIDAMILTPSAQSLGDKHIKKYCETLDNAHIPYLFLDRYISGIAPKVSVDNQESSFLATKYFLECGHKKIGVITGPLMLNSSRNRYKGVKRALEEVGCSLPEKYVYEGKYDLYSGQEGAKKLVEAGVSAIFAFSDIQAYGAIDYLKSIGKSIPGDVSVMGFDDIFYSSLLDVPLTTMRQPVKELAADACRLILGMIEGKEVQKPARLIAELVKRKSVAKI